MSEAVLSAIGDGEVTKGDVLGVAELHQHPSAKRTSDLIHCVTLDRSVSVDFSAEGHVSVIAEVETYERTGVEMEADCVFRSGVDHLRHV